MRHHPGQRSALTPAYMMQPDPPHPCRATLTRIAGFRTMPAPLAIARIRIGQIVWIDPEEIEAVADGIGGIEIGPVIGQEQRAALIAALEPAPAEISGSWQSEIENQEGAALVRQWLTEADPAVKIHASIKIDGIEIAHLLSEEEKAGIVAYFGQLDQPKTQEQRMIAAAILDRIVSMPAEYPGADLVRQWTAPQAQRATGAEVVRVPYKFPAIIDDETGGLIDPYTGAPMQDPQG